MSEVKEIDGVLQSVRRAALHFGMESEGNVTQQLLLLGDSFYGYRFTTQEFTAVWSASDQTLKMFDPHGRCLGNLPLEGPEKNIVSFVEDYPQRKAA